MNYHFSTPCFMVCFLMVHIHRLNLGYNNHHYYSQNAKGGCQSGPAIHGEAIHQIAHKAGSGHNQHLRNLSSNMVQLTALGSG